MFGPSTTFSTTAFGQPSTFNYFHGNGDYSTWGSQLNQQRKPHYDDYYRADTQNMYATPQAMQDSNLALKSVEQGMQNLGLLMAIQFWDGFSCNVFVLTILFRFKIVDFGTF